MAACPCVPLAADACPSASPPAGITFQRLFQLCRERFLVSNEMLLKSFLTEFRDHELLGTRWAPPPGFVSLRGLFKGARRLKFGHRVVPGFWRCRAAGASVGLFRVRARSERPQWPVGGAQCRPGSACNAVCDTTGAGGRAGAACARRGLGTWDQAPRFLWHLPRRRGADGSELLHVPLDESVLQQVLADVEAMS